MSCGEVHSQAREMVTQGYTATLVAATLAISRSSLYYRKKPRGSRADRTYDEQIVVACGEKLAYGYRRVTWWLQEERASRESQAGAAGDAGTRVAGALTSSARTQEKEWGRVEAAEPNQIWQSDMTKIWAGPAVGWSYLVCVIDCCTREIVGWNLSHRCRTEDALAAVEQAVLERLPEGSREADLTLTTDNGTQSTSSRFLERWASRHHASADGVSSPGRQQLHRTIPSQLERRGSLDGGISERGRSASRHRPLDPGVQPRPAASRSRKSHSAGSILDCSWPKKLGPDCLN